MQAGLWALAAIAAACVANPAPAADLMPAAQQNALVQKYCAVCHTDAAMNGGLSLQHFDAAQAPASLTAMMWSKLKSGAMSAAGIPKPDKATVDGLFHAFAVESAGAMQWSVERSKDAAAGNAMLTASALRQAASAKGAGEPEVYRLIASCNPATREGELQLAWAPTAQTGTLAASVDGNAAAEYRVQGSEKMGNGIGITQGLASVTLAGLPLPAESLTVRDLFPNESVTFSFADLPARNEFQACFREAAAPDPRAKR